MEDKILIDHIKRICKNNIHRIDSLCENGINTDVDIGMSYAYRKILDFIERGDIND